MLARLELDRFAIRPATVADAGAIARVQARSWQTSYRGILPDQILDTMDTARRASMRREILLDSDALNLVAYETTFGELVGFCNAGPSRRQGGHVGELYEIYIVDHAKRYGLGRELFEGTTAWCRAQQMTSLIIWVLEANTYARRFYEAMGGREGPRVQSSVRGYPVIEQSYVWDAV
ncbi:MAG: GNAT family N-acetyltransferase [Myxococcales bacterium]|nr:GNAT family N-acetyltransferase [Myxococcales bacterium]